MFRFTVMAVTLCLLYGITLPASSDVDVPAPNISDAALVVAFEGIYEKAEGPGGGPFNPLVVVADDFIQFDHASAFGIPLVLKSRSAARGEQLAWFLYVTEVTATPDQVIIQYEKPYSGKYGAVTVNREKDVWSVGEHKKMHSSSGARMFYGKLYEGQTCKDGSEMAKRWNGYLDAIQAMTEKRPRTEFNSLPSKCPGPIFPDVQSYLQAKQLGIAK